MKRIEISFVLALGLLAAFLSSCAGRPAVRGSEEPEIPAGSFSRHERPEEEREVPPEEPFERALWNVKKNTALIKKYIDKIEKTGISGKKEELCVKGEYVVDGKNFTVLYDLAAAGNTEGVFRIPFFLEDSEGGQSADGELFWSPAGDGSGLLLSLDDDYWHVWRRYFDMFDFFGAKITFFVTGLPAEDNGLAGFCAEAIERGHSIGWHTAHHPDLRKVSREVFDSETLEGAGTLRLSGIPLSAFAYPFGFYEPWMSGALAPAFTLTRGYGASFRFYHREAIDSYLVSKAIDNIIYPGDAEFESHVRLMLLAAKFSDGNIIVPFTTHDISDKASWGIKPRRLEYLLETARELKLRFYTFAEFTGF